MSNDSRWYAVHTYSGYEKKVASNIMKAAENRNMLDEIVEVKIPTEKVIDVRDNGEKHEIERNIFPGYVMVKIATFLDDNDMPRISDEAWLVVRNTRGATGFVGPEGKPIPLTEEEVYKLGVEQKIIQVKYAVGDMVTIIDDSFKDSIGKVTEIDLENNRVEVVTEFFGKEVPVELDLDQVEPLDI